MQEASRGGGGWEREGIRAAQHLQLRVTSPSEADLWLTQQGRAKNHGPRNSPPCILVGVGGEASHGCDNYQQQAKAHASNGETHIVSTSAPVFSNRREVLDRG